METNQLKENSFDSYKRISFDKSNIVGLEVQECADINSHDTFWVRVGRSHFSVSGGRYRDTLQWAKYIRDDLSDLRNNFIKLGFHLNEVLCNYRYIGYDFYSYVESQFNICRSTATKLIAVFKAFSDDFSPRIDKRFEKYSYSQLENMLPIPRDKWININPLMTVAQIKEYNKSLKSKGIADIREVATLITEMPAHPIACDSGHIIDICEPVIVDSPAPRPIRDGSVGYVLPVVDWYRDINDRAVGSIVSNLCAWFGNSCLDYDTAFEFFCRAITDDTVIAAIKLYVERELNS